VLVAAVSFGLGALLAPVAAGAATTCTFTTVGTTMTLDGDCPTDATIVVPDGFTLDGAGYTITAVDPPGGHVLGAIIKNGGSTASVMNVTATTSGLANVCDGGDDRLRGILFDGASGDIVWNTVRDINQGPSGCQEGNAIEIRKAPFDTTRVDVSVTISDNHVAGPPTAGSPRRSCPGSSCRR
jgi:hypothetical protein